MNIPKRTLQIVASVIVIGGSLAYLLSTSMSKEMEYFYPVDEVLARSEKLVGQRFRMGGHVEKGSIGQKPGTVEYVFWVRPIPEMAKNKEELGKKMEVRFTGIVPDTFKDDAEVIVTGELHADGVFYANDLLAKCPSKYEAADKNKGTY